MKLLTNQHLTKQGLKSPFLITLSGILLIGIGLISCNQNQQTEQNKQASQAKVLDSSTEQKQLPIWSKFIPDSGAIKGVETSRIDTVPLIAGKPYTMVTNVSKPTITIYSPKASIGVTGILLKYRVPESGPHWDRTCNCQKDSHIALEDAQRALGLVRFHAKEWNISPGKIGVIGFSAGGHLVADISTHYKDRIYPSMDSADKESCKPNFAIALYPGHLQEHTTKEYQLNPTIPVDSNTPPTFLLQAGNDPVDPIENSLVYYMALKNAGVPAEYHIYAEGKHAFGLRKTNLPITNWPNWLKRGYTQSI